MLKKVSLYEAACNGCEKTFSFDCEPARFLFHDRKEANATLDEFGWFVKGAEHYCSKCWRRNAAGEVVLRQPANE